MQRMNPRPVAGKVCIIVASIIFSFLILVPSVFATAHKQTAVLIHTGTAQDTPTVDPTLVALNKEQLTQQIQQFQLQNDRSPLAWFWNFGAAIIAALATLLTASIAFGQWLRSQTDARNKDSKDQAEQRFQKVVEGLGSDKDQARIGGVILLHTFLEPGYEQFYVQIFNLAVAYLRLQRQPDASHKNQLDALNQALIDVLKASLPKARDHYTQSEYRYLKLDARGIRLEHANLREANLGEIWMTKGSLQNAVLESADFSGGWLEMVDFSNANLTDADLTNANLSGANPEKAASLSRTRMNGVTGITEDQREACKKMGAIFEEVPAASGHSPAPN
jgi:uncharacterized protein YjbI with pentapeptide repeats